MRGAGIAGMKKHRRIVGSLLTIASLLVIGSPLAVADLEGMRGGVLVDETAPAPHLAGVEKNEGRRTRNYPQQPPLIPHSIDGYEISLRANKCLSCHSRRRTVETGAPMPSIAHFMDRDLQVLSDLSPRRYFCTQCHITQTDATPPIGNTFIDAADLPASE